jgi:hypothetical protein
MGIPRTGGDYVTLGKNSSCTTVVLGKTENAWIISFYMFTQKKLKSQQKFSKKQRSKLLF